MEDSQDVGQPAGCHFFFRAWLVRIICSDKVYWVEKAASRMVPSSERSIGL